MAKRWMIAEVLSQLSRWHELNLSGQKSAPPGAALGAGREGLGQLFDGE